jgi:hypothetical protein
MSSSFPPCQSHYEDSKVCTHMRTALFAYKILSPSLFPCEKPRPKTRVAPSLGPHVLPSETQGFQLSAQILLPATAPHLAAKPPLPGPQVTPPLLTWLPDGLIVLRGGRVSMLVSFFPTVP